MMRSVLVALALLVFGGVATMAAPNSAHAEARWENYGADKAYASKEAAKANLAVDLKAAGWSAEAVAKAVDVVKTTAPTRIEIRSGDRLDTMRTGPKATWKNVLAAFKSLGKGVFTVVSADSWTFTLNGVTHEVIIPDVCNNTATRRRGKPEDCVWLLFKGEQRGKVSVNVTKPYVDDGYCRLTYAGTGTGPDGRTFNPNGYKPLTQDASHPCDWSRVNRYFRKEPSATGCINVAEGWYAIKLNRSVLTNPEIVVILCLTSADGKTTLSVDVRKGDYVDAGNGVYIATVWPSEKEIRADYQGKTFLWWERDHQRAAQLMAVSDRR
jgi:hypothetical protein